MSGALSIPVTVLALVLGGKQGVWLAVLGYVASWVLIVKMACANYKLQSRKDVAKRLSSYFEMLDGTIDLLKGFKRVNEGEAAGKLFCSQLDVCNEMRDFIAKNIGPTDAAVFGAKTDNTDMHKEIAKGEFFDAAIGILAGKLARLKYRTGKPASWNKRD